MGMTFYNLTMDDLCDLMCGCPDHDEMEETNICTKTRINKNVPRGTSEQEADNGNYNQPCK